MKIIRASRCFAFSRQTAPAKLPPLSAPRGSLTSVSHGNTFDSATSQPPNGQGLVQASGIFLEGRRFVAKSLLSPLLLGTGAPLNHVPVNRGFLETMPFVYLSIASRSTLLYLQQFCSKAMPFIRYPGARLYFLPAAVLLVAFLQEGDFARSTFFMRAI